MPILSMETQTHMDMAHEEIREERTKEPGDEIAEKEFLKDLHLFMKKRDTPIERIPNLGFKQIDLFLMFKTVRDLGGYHQVTSQQLWKQVYNMLGGNPRSTSAATCTRRHYEKLLLPYECHVKGISMNVLPQTQPKQYPYANYRKDEDDGQRPAKRKLLTIPVQQSPHNLQADPHGHVFPLVHYPHYYPSGLPVLPPHIPISSTVLTAHPPPQPQFSFHPYGLTQTDKVKEPLEQLRFLAQQYKTSTGLTEPLNLSVKESRRDTTTSPASSFAPPSSGKNPKFLNKPSPLYTPHRMLVVSDEGDETQDGEEGLRGTPSSSAQEAYVVDVKTITASGSPRSDSALNLRADKGAATAAQKPSSPKTDFTIQPQEDRVGIAEVKGLNLADILPTLPQENGGKMEIEIPLSVFHNWLRLCGSSAAMLGTKQLPARPAPEGRSEHVLPANPTLRISPQHHSSGPEDLRLRRSDLPSPTQTVETAGNHSHSRQTAFTSYKPLPSGGILRNAASHDACPFDQDYINKTYCSASTNCWDVYGKEAPPVQFKMDSNLPAVQQDFAASKSFNEDTVQGGKEKSETNPSAVLMLNSSSTSLLQLTTEEVMKLKKIISNSL